MAEFYQRGVGVEHEALHQRTVRARVEALLAELGTSGRVIGPGAALGPRALLHILGEGLGHDRRGAAHTRHRLDNFCSAKFGIRQGGNVKFPPKRLGSSSPISNFSCR